MQDLFIEIGKTRRKSVKFIKTLREEREKFDQIERYLQGSLSKEENALMEDRIKHDPAFAEEVQTGAQVNKVVIGAAMDRLRAQMTNDITTLDLKRKSKLKWLTGSFIILLALIPTIFLYNKKDPTKTILTTSKNQAPVTSFNITNDEKQKDVINPSVEIIKRNSGNIEEKQKEKEELILNTNEKSLLITQKEINNSTLSENQKTGNIEEVKHHAVENKLISQPEKCKLSFKPVVHATCKGEATGSIEIDPESIDGGKAPYVFIIDHSGIESGTGYFKALSEGKHLIIVKDNLGCSVSQEINLPDKYCPSKKSFSINPDYGETWKIPFIEGESGKFTILNKGGIAIFKGTFGSGEINEWNGTDLNGATAAIGLYVCILEYTNGKIENLQITIIR